MSSLLSMSFMLLAIGLRLASEATVLASYVTLALYALAGRRQAIEALALSWLFSMLNPGIGGEAGDAALGRYVVLVGVVGSILFHRPSVRIVPQMGRLRMMTIMLGTFFSLHAVLFSPSPDVSILKAVSWTLVITALLTAWAGLSQMEHDVLANRMFRGLVAVMLISLPLIFSPLGYLRNGTGFQGILSHPQSFGPTMALLGVWTIGRMLGENCPPWSLIVLSVTCVALIVLSEARTAAGALVLGLGTALIAVSHLSERSIWELVPALRSGRLLLICAFATIGAIVSATHLGGLVDNFISKSGRAEVQSILEAYELSRGGLIEEMWSNIKERPVSGIGFGIASHPYDMDVLRDSIVGLPVGAAIEKGVMPLAVLEEVGLLGFVLVTAWVVVLLKGCAPGGVAPLGTGITVMFLNMGEATFFSPGGFGLLTLILATWAFSSGVRIRARPAK